MHVVVTVDPEIPVPPVSYGGIERIAEGLCAGLAGRGNRVTLFANPDSTVDVERIGWRGTSSASRIDTLRNALQLSQWVKAHRSDEMIVHSFSRLLYLFPLFRSGIPLVQSYQRHVTPRSVRWGRRAAGGRLRFTACSGWCAQAFGSGADWTVIHNFVPESHYHFRERVPDDAPLVFLGRVERIKGAHHAIAVARRAGKKLIIAGNRCESGPEARYFEEEIQPALEAGRIEYVGPVDNRQKDELLGSASALLFPVEWEEPFGIVMIEALACGTPVIALKRGAVPEVVADGESGWVVESAEAMAEAVSKIGRISRARCRKHFEHSFSDSVIIQKYINLYNECLKA